MKAKALFYIRLRDGPPVASTECYEFRHLFVEQPTEKIRRPHHRSVLLVSLVLLLSILCIWGLLYRFV